MPKTPLRELKPELFADEQDKMDLFSFDDPDYDDELLSDTGADETNDDTEDVPLLNLPQYQGQNQAAEAAGENAGGDNGEYEGFELESDDVPLLAFARQNCQVEIQREEEIIEICDGQSDTEETLDDENVNLCEAQVVVDDLKLVMEEEFGGLEEDDVPLINMIDTEDQVTEEMRL